MIKKIIKNAVTATVLLSLCCGVLTGCSSVNDNPAQESSAASEVKSTSSSLKATSTDSFEYELRLETYKITRYTGSDIDVIVPNEIEGVPVSEIATGAFSGTAVRSIYFPDTVITIDPCLYNCKNLEEVRLPNNLHNYEKISLEGSDKFTSFIVDEECENYSSVDGVLFDKNKETLYRCPTAKEDEYIVPNGVKTINESAFNGCRKITSIVLPEGLETIGTDAMLSCESLITVNFPDSIISIGESAFNSCTSLTSVMLPKSLKELAESSFFACSKLEKIEINSENQNFTCEENVIFNKDKTSLLRCPNNKTGDYSIPDGVKTINESAFDGCAELTSIIIPDSVTTIETRAFSCCDKLTTVTIPSSVTALGDEIFYLSYYLESVYFDGNAPTSLEDTEMKDFVGDNTTLYYHGNTSGWDNNCWKEYTLQIQ